MSPKFIQLHRFSHSPLIDARDEIMVNPRRVDFFQSMPSPSAQPTLDCGTYVGLGSSKHIVVRESVEEIRKLLK